MTARLAAAAVLAAAAALAGAAPALAHHSTAMFEWGKDAPPLQGTIVSVEWTQPHVWITFLAEDSKGAVERYSIEGMSPSYLNRVGWSKRTLNPGDKVTLIIFPLKDGRKGGFLDKAILANGKVMQHAPGRAQAVEGGGR
jgi:hypothetical protein